MVTKMCIKRRNEFRTNNSKKAQGHPAYIYRKEGDEYLFIGITHSPITQGIKNIKLDKNPNKFDKKTSYARPFPSIDDVSLFGPKKKKWKLSRKDKRKMKRIKKRQRLET